MPTANRRTLLLLTALLGAAPAWAEQPASSTVAQGQQALAQGDAAAARSLWESAAVQNDQAVYPLLVRLYEDGPEKDLAEAYKWAWIGLARTWDPAYREGASADYDRLQDRALRYQRQDGRARADAWLEAHPLPTASP